VATIANYAHRHGRGAVVLRPIFEEVRDLAVEFLVRGALRLGHIGVDLPEGHRLKDRFSDSPVAPLEQERPLRAGIKLTSTGQELYACHAWHPLVGKYDSNLLVGCPEVLQRPHARFR